MEPKQPDPASPKQPPRDVPAPSNPAAVGGTEFLVHEVVHGEAARAWGDLSAKIVHYLRTRFGNSSFPQGIEFNDFVSDVMLKILTSIETFEHRGKDSFWKWVQTLGGNMWRDLWRRYGRDRRLGLLARGDHGSGDSDTRPPSATEAAPATGETPTGIVRFRELEKAESECVAKLGKQMRDVYLMRRQRELSFAEISERTGGIKEATLRSHYMRARDQVRECLGSKINELGSRIQGWQ
ncbi:MAG TPA: sigma-70 family RNA polymerase sigma factor [Planctomycetota bacterium]|nr:sigma-70 family RNA polymerase sigma factor [Planctomycetota bacterium]